MIKAVIFDWNGTLLADTTACMAADNHVLRAFGGHPVKLTEYRNSIIIPAINFYVRHGCNEKKLLKNSAKLGRVFHTFYEERAKHCRTRRGAKNLLSWLQKNNITSLILSNHTIEGIAYQLDRLQLKQYVSEVLANTALDNSMKKRNKLEKLQLYLKKHGLGKGEALIIGDSPEEVEMGRAADIESITITGGYYATHRLTASQPNYLVHNLSEIIDIIKRKQF